MTTEIKIPHNFKLRRYQKPLWKAMGSGCKRSVAVWHRRAGKDSVGLHWAVKAALTKRVGLYWHMLPTLKQGRKTIWDGITSEGNRMVDAWPKEVVVGRRNDEMKLEIAGGSVWQVVGSDNYDQLVGANPIGIVFSEYALADPDAWEYFRPILAENDGWAMFLYTPRGLNHGKDLLDMAQDSPDWFSQVLTVDDTKAITKEAIQAERDAGMSEELIQQEFYASFDAPLHGAYYAKQMTTAEEENRITNVPWEPRLPVHTWWDLGVRDSTAIWFVQIAGQEVRLIDYYEASGEGLHHYARELRNRDYVYGSHVAPHDMDVRSLSTGKTRRETMADLGIKFKVVPKLPISEGIDAVRALLPRCWFDKEKCKRGIRALKEYTKDWDDKLKVYRSHPLHNWASHPCDSFRTGAMGFGYMEKRRSDRRPMKTNNRYDPYKWRARA